MTLFFFHFYFSIGERIVILKHIQDDIYMGYCEGVVGNFNAENVYFVELDPRVLKSLDMTATSSCFRNSVTSYATSNSEHQQQSHWAKGKPSFESIATHSSFSMLHLQQQQSNVSSSSFSEENIGVNYHDPYDTSAFNINYSEEEEDNTESQKYSSVNNLDKIIAKPEKKTVSKASPLKQIKNVDEYGFLIKSDKPPSKSNKLTTISLKEYRENELKWLSIINKMDVGQVKRDTKFKKLVRHGIPASVRAHVWQFLAGSKSYQKPNFFNTVLQKPFIPIYDVIERDIARCYPDHIQFMEPDSQGQRDLCCVLRAYAQYNPQLEYCQGMGRLAGLMLMQMTAEESFWLLVATIDKYMNGYFTPSLSQLRIDAYIIEQLLKDHNPKLAHHLEKNDVMPIMYITQWFLTAFTMTLPWESVLRVWDAFYFEGIKVFYRISLAILDICKEHLLNSCPSNSELLSFLLHIPHKYLEADILLSTAFRIHLSKTDIKRYAKKAGTEDLTTSGLPIEHGIKNLQAGSNSSFYGFKSLKKINKI
ncbi:rab-GTPase-TBC domain-containing protein [Cokeromyces recurvatus]|uniref:rab-GTPase-TBC domain-containing protein n=1 Tax=Cokeromyces recurvatus TaxID=90255 RepID=UPI0022203F87|nr:rab-GTPase-TBC domain-containing protein [Cokeromyces recurvatus]KAI7903323.1 rab-GTPase-TBC domain-containing protein [Cokeromyces recurvatus]